MIGPHSLQRYLGREILVFSCEYDDEGDLRQVLTARLVAIEDGCLCLGSEEVPAGEVDWLVDLRLVGAVALQVPKAEKPEKLQALDGGKVRRLKREDIEPA